MDLWGLILLFSRLIYITAIHINIVNLKILTFLGKGVLAVS